MKELAELARKTPTHYARTRRKVKVKVKVNPSTFKLNSITKGAHKTVRAVNLKKMAPRSKNKQWSTLRSENAVFRNQSEPNYFCIGLEKSFASHLYT